MKVTQSPKENKMNLYLNHQKYRLKVKKLVTLHQIITLLYDKVQGIVLEYNKNIVTRNMWNKIYIKPNDTIEIVTIVGGG